MSDAATAETALRVAIVSAGVSLGGLAWQFALYRLSGARLVVRLVPAVITEVGHLVQGPPKGWEASMPEDINIVRDRPWVDAAVIQVVNIGRAPISVSTISLDLGAEPRWKLWKRHTVGLRPIAVHGGLAEVGELRLEAGESKLAVFDFWAAVESGRKVRQSVHLRASASPAGRRVERSPWRERWTIGPEQHHPWLQGPEGDQVELFQAVWRAIAPVAPGAVYEAWLSIVGLLMPEDVDPKKIGVLEVSEALQPIVGKPGVWLLWNIVTALHEHGQTGAWMPPIPERKAGPTEMPPAG